MSFEAIREALKEAVEHDVDQLWRSYVRQRASEELQPFLDELLAQLREVQQVLEARVDARVLTPASALGDVYVQRLNASGMQLTAETLDAASAGARPPLARGASYRPSERQKILGVLSAPVTPFGYFSSGLPATEFRMLWAAR